MNKRSFAICFAKRWLAVCRFAGGALLLALLAGTSSVARAEGAGERINFNRDVQPILSENCFSCHGFDANKRYSGLRLDTPEGAVKKLDSGHFAIVPGKPGSSALVQRIADPGPLHMPPANSNRKLTPRQIEILKAWITQGGHYDKHWSFVVPVRPALPPVKNAAWARTPVDRFVLARLEKEGLKPSPEADRRTLIRRVSFDLTGLPPTLSEVNAFLYDRRPDAYERLVDRLLASPHYGERMALSWLDLARYADTHGFHIDSQRDMWRWRDWVIDAFNTNKPYNDFTVEQIAGDLLPNATLAQKIASGFNRNHPINFEGGAIPEEYQTAYIVDRIDTTATTFLGLTMKCAQCHDHKYDPIKQKDYYSFYAYFNSIAEAGLDGSRGNAVPYLKAPTTEQAQLLDALTKRTAECEAKVQARMAEAAPALAQWQRAILPTLGKTGSVSSGLAAHFALDEGRGDQVGSEVGALRGVLHTKAGASPVWGAGKIGTALTLDGESYVDLGTSLKFDRGDAFSYGAWINSTSNDAQTVLSCMDDGAAFRGWDCYLSGGRAFVHLISMWDTNAIRVNTKATLPMNEWHHVFITYDGSSKARGVHLYLDGKPAELEVTHDSLHDTIASGKPVLIGRRNPSAPFKGKIDEVRIYKRELPEGEVAQLARVDAIRAFALVPDAQRTPQQKDELARFYFETNDPTYRTLAAEAATWRKKRDDLDNAIPTTMVMQDVDKPRETFMLMRGQYDQHGEKVTPNTPGFLPPLPPGAPANRLALARWLVAPENPLTARVEVNRLWMLIFGTGIVKTAEDFGMQGELPSHPELLDWLAADFVQHGWDIKRTVRRLVTSAAYRQSSHITRESLERDPENRLLARAPRIRLQGEFIRDSALALAGLLSPRIGGPSVKPYQPAGLWEELSFGAGFSAQSYVQDHGEDLYRRGMYTFWKRTNPPPSLQTFDAPEREFCLVRRSVTNTPLQALALLNDPTYIEASRKLAERVLHESGAISPASRIDYAFRLTVARAPKPTEVRVLLAALEAQTATFRANPEAANKLLTVGEAKRDAKLNPVELAAWTTVASILLNLDETVTKQ